MGDPVLRLEKTEFEAREPLHIVVPPGEEQTEESPPKTARNRALRIIFTVSFFLFVILIFVALSIFGNDKYYTIKKGENVYTVANKFNVPLNVLLKLNDTTEPASLEEGIRIKIPTIHDVHVVREGDTLYSIANEYGIKQYDLVKYNRLNGAKRMKVGDRVFIPRVLTHIRISADHRTGLVPFIAKFNIDTNTRDRIRSFKWQMGSDVLSRKRTPSATYEEKGTYYVSLTVVDENGNEVRSNTIPIVARSLAHIGFNARKYVTLNREDTFSLETNVIDNLKNSIEFNYATEIEQNPKLLHQIGKTDTFEIINTGYSKITFRVKGYEHTGYFFVSPVPSKHIKDPDVNWYKTQYGTGINGNCGPASVAMGIQWATGLNLPVQNIRAQIGMPHDDGGIGFGHMINILTKYKTGVKAVTITRPSQIHRMIDQGKIAIVLIHSGGIKQTNGSIQKALFDRYYNDSVGHYIIIKGYSLDRQHFIVYDPIPGDWITNRIRYSDGTSMIGKNRYYSTDEVFKSMKTKTLLAISTTRP